MATVLYESETYAFATHRGGGASITRKADNASVYFQIGDDANQITDECHAIFASDADEPLIGFDMLCSDYDHLMDETARNQRLLNL